jgi:hypothetical protein
MMRTKTSLACLSLLALLAGRAEASSPDPDSRASALSTTTGAGRICEGGTNPGVSCPTNSCNGGGTCTGFTNVRIAARGLLTIIADTKTPGQGWTTTTLPGCNDPAPGDRGSCEASDNALFTLLLEFTLNGKKYTYASTFAHLPVGNTCVDDPNNDFDCLPTIDNWGAPNPEAGWTEPAVESTLSERSLFTDSGQHVTLRWGGLPPAAEAAVAAVVGRTGNQRIVLSRVDEVPICTDPTPCGQPVSGARPFSDHSLGTDPLATVRRFKVDIAVVGP